MEGFGPPSPGFWLSLLPLAPRMLQYLEGGAALCGAGWLLQDAVATLSECLNGREVSWCLQTWLDHGQPPHQAVIVCVPYNLRTKRFHGSHLFPERPMCCFSLSPIGVHACG
jgi:hypothetical protein